MKVALVHDWLIHMRGGEKVLEALAEGPRPRVCEVRGDGEEGDAARALQGPGPEGAPEGGA